MRRIKNPKNTATNAIGTIAIQGENDVARDLGFWVCSKTAIFCSNSEILASLMLEREVSSNLIPQKVQKFSLDSIIVPQF
jgi:hypothetical protein